MAESMDVDFSYRGIKLTEIRSLVNQSVELIDMKDADQQTHSFLIKPFKYDPSNEECQPETDGDGTCDLWDSDHVRMPCSSFNKDAKGQSIWPNIQSILNELKTKCEAKKGKISDVQKAFDDCHQKKFNISALKHIIEKVYTEEERKYFVDITLPKMISLAIDVDKICGQTPRKLRMNSNHSLTFSQKQAAALLSCAFFCLYPLNEFEQHPTGQSINFTRLFKFTTSWKIEKLKCFLDYFRRVTDKMPTGVISFQRSVLSDEQKPNWFESKSKLCEVHIDSKGIIEDMCGLLQADFANMYIGGGVMDEGRVQEEIRFTVCPEMLVSILICEVMLPNECIFLIGCEQYTTYDGYCDTFQMKETHHDQTKKDSWGRKLCHVVAIDATYFPNPQLQFTEKSVNRELLKAYVGFCLPQDFEKVNFAIATGNWGCGAFNGNLELKAIIQLLASSQVNRQLVYLTFNDQKLVDEFWQTYKYLNENQVTVGQLYQCVRDYLLDYTKLKSSLFQYLLKRPFQIITDV